MHKLLYILGIVLIQYSAYSQSVEVKSYVDKNQVSINEIITFSITTNSNCQIYTPDFGQLQVVQGPFRSSSSKVVNYNGQRTVQQEIKLTYRLKASKVGSFKIDVIKLVCGGKEYTTKSIKIKVSEQSSSSLGQSGTATNTNSDFFIRMQSNKTNVFQGEPFTISLKIYSTSQPQNIENLELGDSKGLLRKDLNPNQSSFNSEIEIVNGMRFFTTTIRTELCHAQNSGKIKIEPAYISAIFRRGIFNQYRREANSNSLSITVNPLPSGAPSNFNGLVGSIKLNHSVSKNVLKPGDAIDLQVVISGKGNLNTFDDPSFEFPNDFEQFDPEIDNELSYKGSGISGRIIYNYVLIPTYYGNYTIPAYSFSYFDIESKTYKTLSTGSIEIEVLKTANSEPGNTSLVQNKKVVKVEETDIHHLLTQDGASFISHNFLISKVWFYALLLFPVASIWFLIRKRNHSQSESYIQNIAIKTSYSKSKQHLVSAKKLASEKRGQEAAQEISTAFKSFLKQKNNLQNINLNTTYLINLYSEKGWDESEIQKLKTVWNNIEMYQYSPITAEKLEDLILETENLIDKISAIK